MKGNNVFIRNICFSSSPSSHFFKNLSSFWVRLLIELYFVLTPHLYKKMTPNTYKNVHSAATWLNTCQEHLRVKNLSSVSSSRSIPALPPYYFQKIFLKIFCQSPNVNKIKIDFGCPFYFLKAHILCDKGKLKKKREKWLPS